MNKLKYIGAILIAVAALGLQQAQATIGFEFNHSPFHGGQEERDYLVNNPDNLGFTPLDSCCQYGGKVEATGNGNPNEDPFNLLANGKVTVSQDSGTSWTITWNLGGTGFTMCGVLIKDGSIVHGGPSLYSFYNTGETTTGTLTVEFAEGRNISHLSFFVCNNGTVPDGGTTVMLLGIALSGLGFVRRYLAS
jgi:hypothetical protein